MPRCTAYNRRGFQCGRPAASDKRVCYMHGGAPRAGAPKGSQNALKFGLYARTIRLKLNELADLAISAATAPDQGMVEEIAVLRVLLSRMLQAEKLTPAERVEVFGRAVERLSHALRTHRLLTGDSAATGQALLEAIRDTLHHARSHQTPTPPNGPTDPAPAERPAPHPP